jgi:hypothetical protein
LQTADPEPALGGLLERLRGSTLVKEIESALADDVVLTQDGKLLFAYAAEQAALARARAAIEAVLREDQVGASLQVSHWDDELDGWLQTDPPLSAEQASAQEAARGSAQATETRTLVATSGNEIRAEFEQSLKNWAQELGLECTIVEHPHLLRTQIAFTVTGARGKVDQFAKGLKAEGRATIRTERYVQISPL